MLGYHFRHDIIKKYVAVFGSLFSDIQIERFDNNDDVWHQIKVPLTYGPRDKFIATSQKQFGSADNSIAMVSPRIAFVLEQYYRDPARQTNPRMKLRLDDGYVYNSVPYNFDFSVTIVAKTQTDCNRVVEQILPFFSPSLTISIYPFDPDHSISRDLNIVLTGNTTEDTYEGEAEQRRICTATLNFTLKGFMFGPARTGGGVIKKVEVNMHPSMEANTYHEIAIVIPGITADGEPTTDPDLAIDYQEVEKDDDWTFLTTYDTGL